MNLSTERSTEKCSLNVADDLILHSKTTLQESLAGKNVDCQ